MANLLFWTALALWVFGIWLGGALFGGLGSFLGAVAPVVLFLMLLDFAGWALGLWRDAERMVRNWRAGD